MKINCVTTYLSVILSLQISLMLFEYIPVIRSDDWSQSCASNCTCKWTNGKKSAICSSLQLTTIPTTLSTELQVLVLNDNHIPYLNREEFINLSLMNLQRIYLKKSEVHYLHKEAFKDLKILVEIDLSDNRIEMLDKGTFAGNDRLRILYLNGNPLKRLVAYQFPILPHLRTLDLHDCLIAYIDPMALANLNLLEFLYLKNNLLESLSEYVFQHMTNLKTLVLNENPWQCNCKLRKFRTWYAESNLNSVTLVCKGPPVYKDKPWDQVEEKLYGCAPRVEIFNNEDVQNIEIGSNTTFSCLVYGDPLPDVSWELNGKILDNDNVLFEAEHITSDKLWSNITIFNMTSLDAGTYVCSATNIVGVGAQNISIYLTEIVQHVLIKTPETFWYFGLIMGTFGTVFLLILLSFVVCLCKRSSTQRRHPRKPGVKPSASFNDQEKKLLDLSITTTTNDRGDSCIIDNNHSTTTMSKTESVMGFEPIEIHTMENHRNSMLGHHSLLMAAQGGGGHHHHHHPMAQQHMSTGNNVMSNCQQQQLMAIADGSCSVVGIPTSMANNPNSGGGGGSHPTTIPEEFPLNVGVFPPPPEFCSNMISNPAYGNIFISVSVTQDMLDSADVNMYPDLLNISKRSTENSLKNSANKTVETALQLASKIGGGNATMTAEGSKMNVTSFATLPRNSQRRGILKKDSSLQSQQQQQVSSPLNQTNLYPHEEIVSYHNLDTSYSLGCQQQRRNGINLQGLPPPPPPPNMKSISSCHHHVTPTSLPCTDCMNGTRGGGGGGVCAATNINTNNCSTPPLDTSALRPTSKSTANHSSLSSACLKYDNMGRRITASGNSVLSLPDEERLESEMLYKEARQPITKTPPACKLNNNIITTTHNTNSSKMPQDCQITTTQTISPNSTVTTIITHHNRKNVDTNNEFVSL